MDMDARGNKLSSCRIPDQYLKKQKKNDIKILELWQLWPKNVKRKIAIERMFLETPKKLAN